MTAAINRGLQRAHQQPGNRSQQQINMSGTDYYVTEQRNIVINESESLTKLHSESTNKTKFFRRSHNNMKTQRPVTAFNAKSGRKNNITRHSMGNRIFKRAIKHEIDYDQPTTIEIKSASKSRERSPKKEAKLAPEN